MYGHMVAEAKCAVTLSVDCDEGGAVGPQDPGTTVLQGVVDFLFEEDDGWPPVHPSYTTIIQWPI